MKLLDIKDASKDWKEANLITHSGNFHFDDVFASVLYSEVLEAQGKEAIIARLPEIPTEFTGVVVDLGVNAENSKAMVFDHHDDNRLGLHSSSSCGMIFEQYKDILLEKWLGKDIDKDLAEQVFKSDILDSVERNDVKGGFNFKNVDVRNFRGESVAHSTRIITLPSFVRQLNPPWDLAHEKNQRFEKCFNLLHDFLDQYSKILKYNLERDFIKPHFKYKSNFHSKNFMFEENPESLCIFAKENTLKTSLKASQRGLSFYENDIRILGLNDAFTLGDKELSKRFFEAYKQGIEDRENGRLRAKDFATPVINKTRAEDSRIAVLDQYVPLALHLSGKDPEAYSKPIDFAIYPGDNTNTWYIEVLQNTVGSNESIIRFPDEFLSKDLPDLSKDLGCNVIFCNERQMVVDSREKAIEIAEKVSEDAKTLKIPEGTKSVSPADVKDKRYAAKELLLPDSLQKIRKGTFSDCKRLTEVTIPENAAIDTSAFAKCISLKKVEIKPGIPVIGYYAFADCTNLSDVTLPDTISKLHPTVFQNCDIKNVNITMTSFNHWSNIYKIASQFPAANVMIDGTQLHHPVYSFEDFDNIVNSLFEKFPEVKQEFLNSQNPISQTVEPEPYNNIEFKKTSLEELAEECKLPINSEMQDSSSDNHQFTIPSEDFVFA